MQSVVMPQAIKKILPLGNEFVTLIKESSIVSQLVKVKSCLMHKLYKGYLFDPFTPLLVAALLYFLLTFALTRVMNFY